VCEKVERHDALGRASLALSYVEYDLRPSARSPGWAFVRQFVESCLEGGLPIDVWSFKARLFRNSLVPASPWHWSSTELPLEERSRAVLIQQHVSAMTKNRIFLVKADAQFSLAELLREYREVSRGRLQSNYECSVLRKPLPWPDGLQLISGEFLLLICHDADTLFVLLPDISSVS
jgi:hypothetical protein